MQRISISFYQRQKESQKDVSIYIRVTIDGKRLDMASGVKINPAEFDASKNQARGRSINAIQVNRRLDQLKSEINRIIINCENDGEKITIGKLKDALTGKRNKTQSLMFVFRMHNKDIASRIGNGYTDATLEKYNLTKYHIEQFIVSNFKDTDIKLSDLNYRFISGFENFLLTTQKNSISSTNKHTQRLKKILKFAILNEWLDSDPFIRHKPVKEESKEIVFLDSEELKALEEKELPIERLSRIRDFFIFCCYTGLAFKDVHDLSHQRLSRDLDNELQIVYKRQKTGKLISIPLLPKALEIINKYKNDPAAKNEGRLLAIPSNVKFNAYLKEIADLCGINKNLTVHTARKTFATTVLLYNDVPMETASELLGHYSIKMTQKLYGKIVNKKVKRDMRKLKEILSET